MEVDRVEQSIGSYLFPKQGLARPNTAMPYTSQGHFPIQATDPHEHSGPSRFSATCVAKRTLTRLHPSDE